MEVYRITLIKWCGTLKASGRGARWNSEGSNIIYTASSRALACLENIVHRSGEGFHNIFGLLVIDIPDSLKIETVSAGKLREDWYKFENYSQCREIGDDWYRRSEAPVLKVPSSVIPNEMNYLINADHRDFGKIILKGCEDFKFDPRLEVMNR